MLWGASVSLEIAILAMFLGTVLGLVLLSAKQSRRAWLVFFADTWIELARNTPALYQIYMIYFGLGSLGLRVDSYSALLFGITFNNAGYLAETFRGAFVAVPETQLRSARSLGMGMIGAQWHVVLPADVSCRISGTHEPNDLVDPDDIAGRHRRPGNGSYGRHSGAKCQKLQDDGALPDRRSNLLRYRQAVHCWRSASGLALIPVLRALKCIVIPSHGMISCSCSTAPEPRWRLPSLLSAIGTALGLVLGIIRAGASLWINIPVGAILDIFRSVPLLIQLILFNSFNSLLGLHWPTFVVGSVTLGINTAAFCTEIVRSGISAVPGTDPSRGPIARVDLVSRHDIDCPAHCTANGFPKLDRSRPQRDEGYIDRVLDRDHRATAQFADRHQQGSREPLLILSIAGLIYFALSFPIARLGAQLEQKWRVQ